MSSSATLVVNLTNLNESPLLATIEGTVLGYTVNGSATAITSTLTISDADSAKLASATLDYFRLFQRPGRVGLY